MSGRLHELFGESPPPVVGMVHLDPLPGAPHWSGGMAEVLDRARADAHALVAGGVDAVLVENYGDAPFFADRVPAETVAALTRAVVEVARITRETGGRSADGGEGHGTADVRGGDPDASRATPVGVNVLRNDASAALAVAAGTGAAFIRVNVHTGSMFTDQGLIQGRAAETVRLRERLCPEVAILADVFVKHATPPAGTRLLDAARDLVERGRADGLISSGTATGEPADPGQLRAIRTAVPGTPVWVGSGLTPENAAEFAPIADGFIVGSAFQREGRAGAGVQEERVRDLVGAIRAAR